MRASLALPAFLISAPALAAPSGNLRLDLDGIPASGTVLGLEVDSASPGQTVYIAVSRVQRADVLCPRVLNGRCLDLRSPQVLGSVVADANGFARIEVDVPTSPPGTVFHFQAASLGAARAVEVSPVVTSFNPKVGVNRVGTYAFGGSHVLNFNTQQVMAGLLEYRVARTDGLDVCAWTSNAFGPQVIAPPVPCPDCEFAFDFNTFDVVELTQNGDCETLSPGLLAIADATTLRLGFDADASFGGGAYGTQAFYYVPSWVSPLGDVYEAYWTPLAPATNTVIGAPDVTQFVWSVFREPYAY